jgi:hypothetical protein
MPMKVKPLSTNRILANHSLLFGERFADFVLYPPPLGQGAALLFGEKAPGFQTAAWRRLIVRQGLPPDPVIRWALPTAVTLP